MRANVDTAYHDFRERKQISYLLSVRSSTALQEKEDTTLTQINVSTMIEFCSILTLSKVRS